jgi:hypothetical protein
MADINRHMVDWVYDYNDYILRGERIAALESLLADAGLGLRVLKTMLKIEHLPGGAQAAEALIERIEAALKGEA